MQRGASVVEVGQHSDRKGGEERETEILTDIDRLPNEDLLRVREVLVRLRQTT